MDYEALLRKYMAHVVDHEGCDYTDYNEPRDVEFTPEEWAKLQEIAGEINPPRPPRYLRGTEVFVDGKKVHARGIDTASSARGKWMSIEADGLPRSGMHTLCVILPDLTRMEWECAVSAIDDEGLELAQPRFYPLDKAREEVVDNP